MAAAGQTWWVLLKQHPDTGHRSYRGPRGESTDRLEDAEEFPSKEAAEAVGGSEWQTQELSRLSEEAIRHFAIDEEIRNADDRAAAILAVAYLDHRLAEAIKSRLYVTGKEADGLFKGPLRNGEARNQIGYALGLFGKRTYDELKTIHEVRNDFAHVFDELHHRHSLTTTVIWGQTNLTFGSQPIKQKCGNLQLWRKVRWCGNPVPTTAREQFLTSVRLIFDFLFSESVANKVEIKGPQFLLDSLYD